MSKNAINMEVATNIDQDLNSRSYLAEQKRGGIVSPPIPHEIPLPRCDLCHFAWKFSGRFDPEASAFPRKG
ncbi:MAG: hypothetical protein Q4D38_04330 [Planctomycetia bacterium]|nr:hypothetical protein [Planctomycetia bacterium]